MVKMSSEKEKRLNQWLGGGGKKNYPGLMKMGR